MKDANLRFCILKSRTVYTWVGSRRGEHVWCKELFDQLANKRKLYTNNAVKDNGKYFG